MKRIQLSKFNGGPHLVSDKGDIEITRIGNTVTMLTPKGLYAMEPVMDTKNTYHAVCKGVAVTLFISENNSHLQYGEE